MHILTPLRKYAHREALPLLSKLLKTQNWSSSQIRDFQFGKIQSLLKHAAANVPYYRDLFKSLGAVPQDFRSFDDLEKLPVLTKELIRENFSGLVAENVPIGERFPNATGGSTGEPLHFLQDSKFKSWADSARLRGWYNFAGHDCWDTDCAVLWGAMHDIKQNFSYRERAVDYIKHGEVKLNAFNLSFERKMEFVRLCKIFKPKLLRGYFTAIKEFADFVEDNGINLPSVSGIILCAETVDECSRKKIEKVFNSTAFNSYGGRELSLIAMECEHKNGLHEVSENNYVEFEKIYLKGCPDAGNLIITNLNNYVMPFIRYRIGDIGVQSKKTSCACGRGLPLIERVIGRTTEVMTFSGGLKVAGEMFIHLMKDFPLREYQFVQKSESHIVLRYPRDFMLDNALRDRILETYKKYLPDDLDFEFEKVEKFEKTATGKFRFVLKEEAF